jgi:hypothetical protein
MLPRVAVLGPSALFHAASRQRAACNAFSVDRVGQPAKSTTEFGKAGLNLSRPRPITSEKKGVGDGTRRSFGSAETYQYRGHVGAPVQGAVANAPTRGPGAQSLL